MSGTVQRTTPKSSEFPVNDPPQQQEVSGAQKLAAGYW
jgi:hypothetical protein